MLDKRQQFYKKLKRELKKNTKFPSKYLFKFIVPSEEEKINHVESLFNHAGAVITKKTSKTGKFVSISVLVVMKKAEDVIVKYQQAEKVEGIISL